MIVEFQCVTCGAHARKRRSPANGGERARFCSAACYNADRAERRCTERHPAPNCTIECEACGLVVERYRSRTARPARFCSLRCLGAAQRGETNPAWTGGRIERADGYVLVRVSGGYELEHRLVMAEKLGRPLEPGEVVHHVNGRKADNRPDNLVLFASQSEHAAHHAEAAR